MPFEIHKSIGNQFAIILTTKCNNNCLYCHTETNYEPFFEYSFVKKEVLKQIPKSAVEIQITGGEPTIVPYFLDFLKFLRRNYPNTRISLQSNIRMLSVKPFFEKVKEHIDIIRTTFHSKDPETFDEITKVKGSFYQVVKALEFIKEADLNIYFTILILKQNYKQLKETVLFLRNFFPTKNVYLDYPLYLNRSLNNKDLIYVSLSQIKPHIEDALVDDHVFVFNIPPCIFEDEFRKHVVREKFIHDDRYVFPLSECNSCVLKQNCNGYYKQNLLIFKNYSDFKPVKDVKK